MRKRGFAVVLVTVIAVMPSCGDNDTVEAPAATTPSPTAPATTATTLTTTTLTSAIPTATTTTVPPTTTMQPVTTTAGGYTTTELPGSITLRHWPGEPTTAGFRGDDMLFTLTQSCGDCFAGDRAMTREPGGVLSDNELKATVWTVNRHGQTEIHHLWPPQTRMDVLWLTDYSGVTRDTLTGYTPESGDTFAMFDEIVLEIRGDNEGLFGLHADCKIGEDEEVGAALFSFESDTPTPLIAWRIDYATMTLSEIEDLAILNIGECYQPAPRPL